MKNIFKRKLLYVTVAAAVLGPIACNDQFLEVPVTGQLTESQLGSPAGANGLLIGVYSVLNGRGQGFYGGTSNWLWGSVRGGDANKGTNAGDQAVINAIVRYEADPVNPVIGNKWGASYEGVARANFLLASLAEATEIPEGEKAQIAAEARFLRGFYYLDLKKNFNNIPYVDETVDYSTGALEVSNTEDIWPRIEADFQAAYDGLPETQTEIGRANKWAAASFLAKTYMYQNKVAEAKALFDLIIANGVTSSGTKYELVPDFADVWRGTNENSSEFIFVFQAAAGTGSINNTNQDFVLNWPYSPDAPGTCCGFFAPSFELANSYRTTAAGLPYLDGAYNETANALKTDQGILSTAAFTPDEGPLDPRIDHTIGRRGIAFLDWGAHPGFSWIREQSYAGPYSPKKFAYTQTEIGTYTDVSSWTPGYTSLNFPLMRFADVLLMAAEAEAQVGDLELARTYLNLVRERAANSFLLNEDGTPAANYVISLYEAPFASPEMALQAIRFERKLELALEGHRFYDLLRYGVVADAINDYIDYEEERLPVQLGGAEFTPNQDEYLPIPQTQIDLQGSDILTQNPGY